MGEIESRLQGHAQVREAVVLALDGQLVAYLVATDPTLLGDTARQAALRLELRDYLKRHLADYMVPAHLMLLLALPLPLTANGKLDRKALPAPDTALLQQAYVAPRSTLEQQLAAIWSEVLKVERVGLSDNFFELGGHSLLATQVIARARQVLGLDVELRSLFETPDLAAFAASAGQGDRKSVVPCPAAPVVPLAVGAGQQRLSHSSRPGPERPA